MEKKNVNTHKNAEKWMHVKLKINVTNITGNFRTGNVTVHGKYRYYYNVSLPLQQPYQHKAELTFECKLYLERVNSCKIKILLDFDPKYGHIQLIEKCFGL
jgi:hypothetical protein